MHATGRTGQVARGEEKMANAHQRGTHERETIMIRQETGRGDNNPSLYTDENVFHSKDE